MSAALTIRKATCEEFATAIDWAAQEGWNPGLEDLAVFHATDADGFLMGWIDGEAVSAISVVRYGDDFGFLGFYIVHPNHRGSGVGLQTWKAGMAHLQGRSVGLDGVVEQEDNYRKSGFAYVGRNVRYSGTVQAAALEETALTIHPICADDLTEICYLDRACFGKNRDAFTAGWCFNSAAETRQTLVCRDGEKLVGFGTIRQCMDGYKIAPLFCENANIAQLLFLALAALAAPKSNISIDVPSSNAAAIKLAENAGLLPSFETARMVHGEPPSIDWGRVFGLTSFELG